MFSGKSGKQARRTGTSSPLGAIVDHAVDAMNASIGTVNLWVVLGLGFAPPHVADATMDHDGSDGLVWTPTIAGTWMMRWLIWEIVAIGLLWNTWEELNTGTRENDVGRLNNACTRMCKHLSYPFEYR